MRVIFAATVVLAAAGGAAQAQYPAYLYAPPPSLQAPPSWSYDPYTSGVGPCPQWFPGDPPCRVMMPPTFGQPNYWPRR